MADNSPLSVEEVAEACDIFFPLMSEVRSRIPDADIPDVLKVMKSVAELAQQLRVTKKEEIGPFGFNKDQSNA
jgi:hypothetical protein